MESGQGLGQASSAAASAAGDAAGAVAAAERAVALQPFRESAYVRLMAAHSAAGNRGEALRAYERCRKALAEELGVDPSPREAGEEVVQVERADLEDHAPPPCSGCRRPHGTTGRAVLPTTAGPSPRRWSGLEKPGGHDRDGERERGLVRLLAGDEGTFDVPPLL